MDNASFACLYTRDAYSDEVQKLVQVRPDRYCVLYIHVASTKTVIIITQARLIENLQIGHNVKIKQCEPKVTFCLVNLGSKIP